MKRPCLTVTTGPMCATKYGECLRCVKRGRFPLYSGLSCSVVAAAVAVTMDPASPRPYLVR